MTKVQTAQFAFDQASNAENHAYQRLREAFGAVEAERARHLEMVHACNTARGELVEALKGALAEQAATYDARIAAMSDELCAAHKSVSELSEDLAALKDPQPAA